MRHPLIVALSVSLALGACATGTPTGASGGKKATTTASAAKTPKPGPNVAASTAPAPAPLTGTIVTGLVQVDAHYVVAAGGGNVIAAGGGNVIAAGGGNVVAAGGGNVVAAGGGNYRVAAAADVPVGTILPVKGMAVTAYSMVTGKPFGAAVTTDEKGGFKVSVPEGTADNVILSATFPGSDNPRLTYALVVSPEGKDAKQIDEDTALVSKYLRECLVGRIAGLLSLPVSEDPITALSGSNDFKEIPAPLKTLAATVLGKLQKRSGEKGIDKGPEVTRRKVAKRIAEVLLAKTKLSSLTIQKSGKNAIATLVDVMGKEREAAAVLLKSDPTYFKTRERYTKSQFYLKEFPDGLQRPSDLGQYLVTEYFSQINSSSLRTIGEVHAEVGVGAEYSEQLTDATTAIVQALILKLITDTSSQDTMMGIFEES